MSALRWYDDLPDAVQTLGVGGDKQHRVRWRHGKVIVEDHDVEAEQAFVALGGASCVCLDIAELFTAPPALADIVPNARGRRPRPAMTATSYRATAARSSLMPQSPGLMSRIPATMRAQFSEQMKEHQSRLNALALLESIDGEFRRRLLCASALSTNRRGLGGYPDDWMNVTQFYSNEITPPLEWSLRGARRNMAAGAKIRFQLRLVPNRDDIAVEGLVSRRGGEVELAIQPQWLADVWAHGISLVDDRAVVAVRERRSVDLARVVVVCWSRSRFELTEPCLETVFITRDELGFWHVAHAA